MNSLIVECVVSPPLDTNTYIVADPESKTALIVDPSCVGQALADRCRQKEWRVHAVVLTHEHIDHTCEAALACAQSGAPLVGHALTAEALNDPVRSGALWLGMDFEPCEIARALADGDFLELGNQRLQALYTPGHSNGSICLLGEGFCIVGDLLFRDGVGRWDLQGGDQNILTESLQRLADVCPDEAIIYPGHGPETTMGRERRQNPYMLDWLKQK